jgi:transposase
VWLWSLPTDSRRRACVHGCRAQFDSREGWRAGKDRSLDAAKLARLLRAGELHAVWVPDAADEAMRDLVRSRTDAMQHLHTSRRQLLAFLLRQGRIYPGLKPWSRTHLAWLADQA